MSFEGLVDVTKKFYVNRNAAIVNSEAFVLHSNPEHKIVSNSSSRGGSISTTMEVLTRTPTPNDFTFTYSASPKFYDEYLPTIQKMIDSFNEIQSSTSSTSNP
jgi:hypothetical protein